MPPITPCLWSTPCPTRCTSRLPARARATRCQARCCFPPSGRSAILPRPQSSARPRVPRTCKRSIPRAACRSPPRCRISLRPRRLHAATAVYVEVRPQVVPGCGQCHSAARTSVPCGKTEESPFLQYVPRHRDAVIVGVHLWYGLHVTRKFPTSYFQNPVCVHASRHFSVIVLYDKLVARHGDFFVYHVYSRGKFPVMFSLHES